MSVAAQVFVIVVAGVLGLVVGSFLNVVVYRVPAGVSLLRASACPTCDVPIRWQQNVPVLSWVALRGRCAHCGSAISPRYPLVEAATALGFALVASVAVVVPQAGDASWWLALAAFLYLAAITVALALIDVDVRRLPDGIVLPSYGVAIVLLALSTLVGHDLWPIVRATIGMAALYTFYLLLWLIRPDGMGGGDVKLAGLLGWYLAWLGLPLGRDLRRRAAAQPAGFAGQSHPVRAVDAPRRMDGDRGRRTADPDVSGGLHVMNHRGGRARMSVRAGTGEDE